MEDKQSEYVRQITEQHAIGQAILNQLFSTELPLLRTILKDMLTSEGQDTLKIIDNSCIKIFRDDIPERMEFHDWNSIIIDWMGVELKREHGGSKKIISFNKYFKL